MIEGERLASLQSLQILDTGSEAAFDQLTQLAAGALDVPVAAVTFVDEARVWLKSHPGTDVAQTDREGAFCHHVVERGAILVVEDAMLDPRFATSTLCTRHGVRFYAGAPISLATGAVVGAICTLDVNPRPRPPASALVLLEGLAIAAGHLLDLRRELIMRRETEQILREHARLLELAEEMAEIGTWRLKFATRTVYQSPAASKVYGFKPGAGTYNLDALLALYERIDRAKIISLAEDAKRNGQGFSFDARLHRVSDGSLRDVRGKASVEVDAQGHVVGLIGVFRDVTSEKKVFGILRDKRAAADARAVRMGKLASTDVLTALPNRRAFLDRAERAIATGSAKALAVLDLDHFKTINERFGHDGGDFALKTFGRMCDSIADRHCTIARIGGEEFGILSTGLEQQALADRIEMLRTTLATTPIVTREGCQMQLTFSAGLAAVYSGDDWHSLYQRADRALYCAKKEGRDRVAIAA